MVDQTVRQANPKTPAVDDRMVLVYGASREGGSSEWEGQWTGFVPVID